MRDFTKEDIERIEDIIDARNVEQALAEIKELHPADIAELFQSLNLRRAEWLFDLIDDEEKKADVLMELDEEDRAKLLEDMSPEEIGDFIDLLDTDDAVDLIQELDEEDREEVIQHIDDVEQ
ncbi:MAG: magnesium transporter, partial [Muribaculaceae bacterium]|nr:magnesium transporter [Muribaculaceae bacterium]